MVPATSALLSLLALKLLDKERRSHISDFNFDEALGLFAGLNILPKTTFATDYSSRTQREHQHRLLAGWLTHLAPLLLPEASTFCLDFHPIPYRGDPTGLDTHYITPHGHAGPSVLTFFAHEPDHRVLCYAKANLTRTNQRCRESGQNLTNEGWFRPSLVSRSITSGKRNGLGDSAASTLHWTRCRRVSPCRS